MSLSEKRYKSYEPEFHYKEKDVKEFIKKVKKGIEQMKRDILIEQLKDEEIDYWMNKLETPLIKLIDEYAGEKLK